MRTEFLKDLESCLDYNPETGEFRWKVSVGNGRIQAGSFAGNVNSDKRLRIRFQKRRYLSHRLAWLLTYGKWPEGMIDHIDGNPLNNRIDNLRDVNRSINGQNQRKAMSHNESKFLGVSRDRRTGRFVSRIMVDGKDRYIGTFKTAEEAHRAYIEVKREIHKGCTI